MDLANSGGIYPLDTISDPVSIVFWGEAWGTQEYIEYTGCPHQGHMGWGPDLEDVRGQCPLAPHCTFRWTVTASRARQADVAVFILKDNSLGTREILHRLPGPIKIIYRREALWDIPGTFRSSQFDLDMTFDARSGLPNPVFMRPPVSLLDTGNVIATMSRPHFAMSLISDCHTRSHRERYLDLLVDHLGRERVHRYGACGDGHEMPRNNFDRVPLYKFYFAFENSITEGYVTEKLFHPLSLGPVPVYMGAPDVYNITKTKSFINVMDFSSPKSLANYLLYLDKNPEEYAKFHTWRTSPNPFTDEYLALVAERVPGPVEHKIHRDFLGHERRSERRALCCRLCNLAWLRKQVEKRNFTSNHYLHNSRARGFVDERLFAGALGGG